MIEIHTDNEAENQSMRRAAWIGGVSLLLMAVTAGFAQFVVMENLVTYGNAEQTAADVLASSGLFIAAIAAFFIVVLLDVIVAWALFKFFRRTHKNMSKIMSGARIVYAMFLLIATVFLLLAFQSLNSNQTSQAMEQMITFQSIWDVGLILFGIHLVLLGYLSFKATYTPTWLGILLVIAGLSYFIDNIGLLITNDLLGLTSYAFIGEVALLVWLLVKGRTVTLDQLTGD